MTDPIKYLPFETHQVSTRTFVAVTNLTINIEKMFKTLPVTPWIVIPKKRGRKSKEQPPDPNAVVPKGSIITMKYMEDIRGVELRPKKIVFEKVCDCLDRDECECKSTPKKTKFFRNSVTFVMVLDKLLNFKVSNNGKFQITGCKNPSHAGECVQHIWTILQNYPEIYTLRTPQLMSVLVPAMRNIDFDLGFIVDRHKLDNYINTKTSRYFSILQDAFGYTGVNIKSPITQDQVRQLFFNAITWHEKDQTWTSTKVPFSTYYSMLSDKDKKKEDKKERMTTFLVFYSGKVIMSGMVAETMHDAYYDFLNVIKVGRNEIEEKLVKNV